MNNFELYNPTKIIFGKGEIAKLKLEIPKDAKILLTYGGGSIKKNGIYNQVSEALNGYDWQEFGGIPPNPEYKVLMKALDIIKKENITFLLAVGGGSVIDGTKFLSSAALYDGNEPWDILKNRIRTEKGMPFGTVLTLPATGSEMNSGAVVTNEETNEKFGMGGPGLFPKFSILDPSVVSSIPERQIANGLADSFTHVLEQYITYPVDALLQDRLAESVLISIIETAPRIMESPGDYKSAANFMWNCTMALNGLIQKGVPTDWAIHAMGHELTAFYGIDHARTLAILTKSHYRYNLKDKQAKLAQCGERVFGITLGEEKEKAEQCTEAIEEFYLSLGIPTTLSSYTVDYEGTAQKIAERFTERGWTGIGEHGKLTPKDVEKIVEMSY